MLRKFSAAVFGSEDQAVIAGDLNSVIIGEAHIGDTASCEYLSERVLIYLIRNEIADNIFHSNFPPC